MVGVRCEWSTVLKVIPMMPRKGITQIQNSGGIEGQVVGQDNVARVGCVLGMVEIPAAGENVGRGEDQLVIGKAGEEALPLTFSPVDAHIEPVRVEWIEAGQSEIIRDVSRR